MLLRNFGHQDREESLHRVLLGALVLAAVEVLRNVVSLILVVERAETLQEVLVLLHAVVCHVFVSELSTEICEDFPAVGVDSIDSHLFNHKICQEIFMG